jgi:hypothetical protein
LPDLLATPKSVVLWSGFRDRTLNPWVLSFGCVIILSDIALLRHW